MTVFGVFEETVPFESREYLVLLFSTKEKANKHMAQLLAGTCGLDLYVDELEVL